MRDLDKALDDIVTIRAHIAAGTAFCGYGPAAVAATAAFALIAAIAQHLWLDEPTSHPVTFFAGWLATALVAVGIIGVEMRARSRRHHSGLADAMVRQAAEQFLPAGATGAFLAVVMLQKAPETVWMLPGLWQLLVGLGLFASARSLPRIVALTGVWYFVAGACVLILTSESHALSPWLMGLPFIIGQLLMAALLHLATEALDADG